MARPRVSSRFYGITIQMFLKEHGVPHFHARYGGQVAVFTVESFEHLRGELPRRAELVQEPAIRPGDPLGDTNVLREHRYGWGDLDAADRHGERARAGESLAPIEPLA